MYHMGRLCIAYTHDDTNIETFYRIYGNTRGPYDVCLTGVDCGKKVMGSVFNLSRTFIVTGDGVRDVGQGKEWGGRSIQCVFDLIRFNQSSSRKGVH